VSSSVGTTVTEPGGVPVKQLKVFGRGATAKATATTYQTREAIPLKEPG